MRTESLSEEELEEARRLAYRELYFDPTWILGNLYWVLKYPEDFYLGVRYFARVLRNYFIYSPAPLPLSFCWMIQRIFRSFSLTINRLMGVVKLFRETRARENVRKACKILAVPLVIKRSPGDVESNLLRETFLLSRGMGSFVGSSVCGNCEMILRTISTNVARTYGVPFVFWGSSA